MTPRYYDSAEHRDSFQHGWEGEKTAVKQGPHGRNLGEDEGGYRSLLPPAQASGGSSPAQSAACGSTSGSVSSAEDERRDNIDTAVRAEIAATIYKIIIRRIPHRDRPSLHAATKSAARIIEYKLHQIAPSSDVYADRASLEGRVVAMAGLVRRCLLDLRRQRRRRTEIMQRREGLKEHGSGASSADAKDEAAAGHAGAASEGAERGSDASAWTEEGGAPLAGGLEEEGEGGGGAHAQDLLVRVECRLAKPFRVIPADCERCRLRMGSWVHPVREMEEIRRAARIGGSHEHLAPSPAVQADWQQQVAGKMGKKARDESAGEPTAEEDGGGGCCIASSMGRMTFSKVLPNPPSLPFPPIPNVQPTIQPNTFPSAPPDTCPLPPPTQTTERSLKHSRSLSFSSDASLPFDVDFEKADREMPGDMRGDTKGVVRTGKTTKEETMQDTYLLEVGSNIGSGKLGTMVIAV